MRELMKHKPIEKIRVTEICKEAEHHGPPAIFLRDALPFARCPPYEKAG